MRRRDRDVAHSRSRHPGRAAEGLDRDIDAGLELRGRPLRQVKHLQVGLVELALRQKPEARQDERPPPLRQLELEELDRQRVARLGTVDVDRPGERVDHLEVKPEQVVRRRASRDLTAGEVVGLDRDRVARAHRQDGLEPGIPAPGGGRGALDQVIGHGDRQYRMPRSRDVSATTPRADRGSSARPDSSRPPSDRPPHRIEAVPTVEPARRLVPIRRRIQLRLLGQRRHGEVSVRGRQPGDERIQERTDPVPPVSRLDRQPGDLRRQPLGNRQSSFFFFFFFFFREEMFLFVLLG